MGRLPEKSVHRFLTSHISGSGWQLLLKNTERMTEMSLPSRRSAHPVNLMHCSVSVIEEQGDTCPVDLQDNVESYDKKLSINLPITSSTK